MADIASTKLPLVTSLADDDDLLVNASGNTSRIKYGNLAEQLTGWNNISGKPFDSISSNYFSVETNGRKFILSLSKKTAASIEDVDVIKSQITELYELIGKIDKSGGSAKGSIALIGKTFEYKTGKITEITEEE